MRDDTSTLPPFGVWAGQFWGLPAPGVRAAIRELEELGYGLVWISESYAREAFSFAAVLLSASERLVIGTGIANLWVRDATAMANGARTLAEAFPGRFVLGVGISHAGPLVKDRGHTYGKPLQTTREYLQAMAASRYTGPGVPERPLVLLGALGDGMLGLAAAATDGAHPYLVTVRHTDRARAILGPDRLLAPEQKVLVGPASEGGRNAAREALRPYLSLDNYRRSLLRQGFTEDDLADGGSDRLVDELVLQGTAEHVAERLRGHLAAGADHVAVNPVPGPSGEPLEQLRALAPVLLGDPARADEPGMHTNRSVVR